MALVANLGVIVPIKTLLGLNLRVVPWAKDLSVVPSVVQVVWLWAVKMVRLSSTPTTRFLILVLS